MLRLYYRHLFCGHLVFFQVCILVYLFFTGNNYPNYNGNFEGRFKQIVMEKILSWYMCVGTTVSLLKIIIHLDISF